MSEVAASLPFADWVLAAVLAGLFLQRPVRRGPDGALRQAMIEGNAS